MKSVKMNSPRRRNYLRAIIFLLAANSSCAVTSAANQRYPLGIAIVLFLLPALFRELGLRKGYPLRPFGVFEWTCFAAGLVVVIGFFVFKLRTES